MKKVLCAWCLWDGDKTPNRAEFSVSGDSLCRSHAEGAKREPQRPAAPFQARERKAVTGAKKATKPAAKTQVEKKSGA